MRLQICFNFLDSIVMGNILEWDQKLKRATVSKLFKFSNPGTVLEQIIKDKAYQVKDGFYNLSISGSYRLGMDVKSLGNGSYVVCVYEPRLTHQSGIDYTLKYHFAFIGEKEVFEKFIVCCPKPYTTVFNNFTNRDLFKEGVTLDYLAEESQVSSSVISYLRELVKSRTTTEETKLSKDEPEVLELTSQTMEESKKENDDVKLNALTCTVVESKEENFITHDQTLRRCPIRDPNLLERFIRALTQPKIKIEDWMGVKAVEHFKNVGDIPAIPSIVGYTLHRHADAVMFGLEFDKNRSYADIITDVKLLFKIFFSKYTGVVNVGGTCRQTFYFNLYDKNNRPLKIIPCLVKLRLWLEYNLTVNKEYSSPTPESVTTTWGQRYGEQDLKPKESFVEEKSESVTVKEVVSESTPTVEPSTEIVKLIKEKVDLFRDTFDFIPDAYTLSQLLVKGVLEENRSLEAFDNMTYRDLYCLSKVMEMDDRPAQEFNEFIGSLLRYMEVNGV